MAISLTDDLALLAFDHDKGLPFERAGSALPHALGATLVFDLVALGAVEVRDDDHVAAIGSAPDEPLLAEAWHSIEGDRKVRKLGDWVAKPTRLVKHLPRVVYDDLSDRGVLAHDGTTAVFRRERYRELDTRPGRDLVAALGAVLDGERDPTADEVLLLALVPVCRLTSAVFPDRDHGATDHRIKALLATDPRADDVAARVARAVAAGAAAAVVAAGA